MGVIAKTQGFTILLIGMAAGTHYLADQENLRENYYQVEGKVTKKSVDCFVRSDRRGDRRELQVKKTGERAYMDCKTAKTAARVYGYVQSDVQERYTWTYSYISPVNGRRYFDTLQQNYRGKGMKIGARMIVYAHKKTPDESRTEGKIYVPPATQQTAQTPVPKAEAKSLLRTSLSQGN